MNLNFSECLLKIRYGDNFITNKGLLNVLNKVNLSSTIITFWKIFR